MKLKTLLWIVFIAVFSSISYAQSVVITPRKVTYTRLKPMDEGKKTFTVNYPKVKAATTAISRKIESTISYERVLKLNIQEEKTESQWLYEADYEVGYNKNGLLSINLWLDGSAAYPTVFMKTVVVNLKTGNRVKPTDIFTNLAGLAAVVKKIQQAEIKQAKEDYKKDADSADFDGSEYFDNADFTIKDLEEFSIDDKGVTFIYSYGFAHVVRALEPSGSYALSWAELKPFMKRGGLLEKFIR